MTEILANSISKVIKRTGLSRTTLYKARKENRLKEQRIGTRVLILEKDLLDFLDSEASFSAGVEK